MPSPAFIAAITGQNTAEAVVHLVTIEHADFVAPLRYCTGGEDIVSNGATFTARAMKVQTPGEGEPGARRARILIDNIEQDAVASLRSVQTGRPSVTIETILASDPDLIELSYPALELRAFSPSGDSIDIEIAPRDDSEEEFPVQTFSPMRTPGLH